MKTAMKKQFSFICKSLLWSLLLYASVMSVINWNEIKTVFTNTGNNSSYAVMPATEHNSPLKVRILQPLKKQTGSVIRSIHAFEIISQVFSLH